MTQSNSVTVYTPNTGKDDPGLGSMPEGPADVAEGALPWALTAAHAAP